MAVRVSPGAKQSRIQGRLGNRLKVRVVAPPEAGRANEGVLELIASALGLSVRNLEIVAGSSSRDKVIAFSGIDDADLRARLATLVASVGAE
ncbi:MAG: DUF167 domain-containing protein [Actinobacteria bacterium]|nr:DUF167 domain-containing protein [Actinomycetota bacterium]